jgi:hypothetical protein
MTRTLTVGQLRRELNARAESYARRHGLLHEFSTGTQPTVIFGRDELGRHGNFHPASYAQICANPDWARRLEKPHTASRRSIARKDWRWMELDSACSSDALLINIFCHPEVWDCELYPPVATLLGVDRAARPAFGECPGVPLRTTLKPRSKKAPPRVAVDRTEIDMVLGDLFVEAKLTESDFQTAAPALVTRYRDLEEVFDPAKLPRHVPALPPLPPNLDPEDPTVNLPIRKAPERIAGYQLIRNVLAASAAGMRFCVLCDARRTDLIEQWFAVLSAVRSPSFAARLHLLTWQELTAALPFSIRRWTEEKYGI